MIVTTYYDKKTEETVVIAKNQYNSVEVRVKEFLLCLDKDFKMRQLQRRALKELNNEK